MHTLSLPTLVAEAGDDVPGACAALVAACLQRSAGGGGAPAVLFLPCLESWALAHVGAELRSEHSGDEEAGPCRPSPRPVTPAPGRGAPRATPARPFSNQAPSPFGCAAARMQSERRPARVRGALVK